MEWHNITLSGVMELESVLLIFTKNDCFFDLNNVLYYYKKNV